MDLGTFVSDSRNDYQVLGVQNVRCKLSMSSTEYSRILLFWRGLVGDCVGSGGGDGGVYGWSWVS